MPIDLRFAPDEAPLLTDLYELTMAASYFALGFNQPSCFYLGVRRMPLKRGFRSATILLAVLSARCAGRYPNRGLGNKRTPRAIRLITKIRLRNSSTWPSPRSAEY